MPQTHQNRRCYSIWHSYYSHSDSPLNVQNRQNAKRCIFVVKSMLPIKIVCDDENHSRLHHMLVDHKSLIILTNSRYLANREYAQRPPRVLLANTIVGQISTFHVCVFACIPRVIFKLFIFVANFGQHFCWRKCRYPLVSP